MITLWIPAAEQPRWACVLSWWALKTPNDEKLHLYRSGANNPKYTWNRAVQDFLKTDDEWLLSVHNDVVLDPDTLLRLLSWDKPLVSALIFMRQSPVVPHTWKKYPDGNVYAHRIADTRKWFFDHPEYIKFGAFTMQPRPDDALAEISFTSTSCTLIHRTVLEGMREMVKDVWFLMDDDYTGGGEDRRFYEFAALAGFPAYQDRSAVVGHLVGDIPTSSADFIAWDSISVFHKTGEPESPEGKL